MNGPSIVVYDIGNVLVEWRPERVYDPILTPEARDQLFHAVGLMAMNEAVDAGAPFHTAVADLAAAHPAHAAHIALWAERWTDMFHPVIDGSVRLLRRLRSKGIPVLALSNFGAETFAMAEDMYPFLSEFDGRYISAHLGVIKPDPRIYAMLEADTGHPPDALLFVDDKAENIAAARARGWHGHLFEGVDGWARSLVDHRLLTEQEAFA